MEVEELRSTGGGTHELCNPVEQFSQSGATEEMEVKVKSNRDGKGKGKGMGMGMGYGGRGI